MQETERTFKQDFVQLVKAIEAHFASYHIGKGKHYTALATVTLHRDIHQLWVDKLGLADSWKEWCSSSANFIREMGLVVDLDPKASKPIPILWSVDPETVPERFRAGIVELREIVEKAEVFQPYFTTDFMFDMSAQEGFSYVRADLDMNWVSSVPNIIAQMADHDGRRSFHRKANPKGRALNNARSLHKRLVDAVRGLAGYGTDWPDTLRALRAADHPDLELNRDMNAIDVLLQYIAPVANVGNNVDAYHELQWRAMSAVILHYRTLANRLSSVLDLLKIYYKEKNAEVALIEHMDELNYSPTVVRYLQKQIFDTQLQEVGTQIPKPILNFNKPLLGKVVDLDPFVGLTGELSEILERIQGLTLPAFLVEAIEELREEGNEGNGIYGSYMDLSTLTQVRLLQDFAFPLNTVYGYGGYGFEDCRKTFTKIALTPTNIGVNPNGGDLRIPVRILHLVRPEGILGLKPDALWAVIKVPASDIRLFESGIYFRPGPLAEERFTSSFNKKQSVVTKHALNMPVPYIQGVTGHMFIVPLSAFDDFHVAPVV